MGVDPGTAEPLKSVNHCSGGKRADDQTRDHDEGRANDKRSHADRADGQRPQHDGPASAQPARERSGERGGGRAEKEAQRAQQAGAGLGVLHEHALGHLDQALLPR